MSEQPESLHEPFSPEWMRNAREHFSGGEVVFHINGERKSFPTYGDPYGLALLDEVEQLRGME